MNNRKVIFNIENRASDYIGHWFLYVITGLRHLNKNTSRAGRLITAHSSMFEQNADLYDPSFVSMPYYVHFAKIETFQAFQQETLDLLSDLIIPIKKEDIKNTDIVINNYGEFIVDNPYHISEDGYKFLQNLLLECVKDEKNSQFAGKNFYLRRDVSHNLRGNDGVRRRQVINEDELVKELEKESITPIRLEDYKLQDKIILFRDAKHIISPNSGGLVFTLASGKSQKILEINVKNPHQINHQYSSMCQCLGVEYHKFFSNKIDNNDNMIVDIESFMHFYSAIK